ncbi:MAG: allantoicase [Actinomycetota bacterium]|jgi:allantoicase|nr:allantoicase [Actinomycetota bacterium]
MSVDFTTLPDLCDERLGAAVVGRSDEYFALADNLLRPEPAEFKAGLYNKRGKWMDGWETRRRRGPGVDWCIVRLGAPGIVRGVVVDTAHFTGNHPQECWLEGCAVDGYPSAEELADADWVALGSRTSLSGDHKHLVNVSQGARITHVRLTISPDGGVARLRVHGEPVPDPRDIWGMPLDLAGLEFGGLVVDCSDMYFSHRHNLNQPTAPASMADGWETRRRRGPGNDWAIVRLADEGVIRIAEVDTRFFKGNAPASFSLDGKVDGAWEPVLAQTALRPHMRHRFRVPHHGPVTHVRLNVFPDGGVARLRLWGSLSQRGAEDLGLRWLASLTPARAENELHAVCGSTAWAREVAQRRPYETLADLRAAAARAWEDLDRDERLQTFAAHPPLGRSDGASPWSRQEQAASARPSPETAQALAEGNREYQQRFGYVFLLSATGLSADDVLARLGERLGNDPDTEFAIACAELQKIMDLRLAKLITP